MADEYIRKQDAVDYCKALMNVELVQHTDDWGYGKERYNQTEVILNFIENRQPADVVPVVHGKWIPHSEKSREYIGTVLAHVMYDYWLCNTCGYRVENGQPMYNFCPNCGAKMDEYCPH